MNSYQFAMLGNILLSLAAVWAILDPVDIFGAGSDDTEETDDDQTAYLNDLDNEFLGDVGSDTVFGGAGEDVISGAEGGDFLFGGDGDDTVSGDAGDDTVEGNIGNDVLVGGDGDDLITGGAGTDSLDGGAGNDILSSDRLDAQADFSRGNDETLSGGDGDDRLVFSSGDTASGGEGQDAYDLVVVDGERGAVIEDFDVETESLSIYYDPADFGDGEPVLSVAEDSDTGVSEIFLDDQSVLTLNNVQDLDPDSIDLLPEDQLVA